MELNGKNYILKSSINDDNIEDVCGECALKDYCDHVSDEMNNIEYMLCEGDEFYDEDEFQYYVEDLED